MKNQLINPLAMMRAARLCVPRQKGFSLITTLILLVVVTILGVGAAQIVLQAEKATRYERDSQIAFQAAEAALLDAEFDIRGPNSSASQRLDSFVTGSVIGFVDGCGTGTQRGLCYPAAAGQKPVWYSVNFQDESNTAQTVKFGDFTGRTLSTGTSGIRPALLPRYIIEVIQDPTPGSNATTKPTLYRVTAMGFGPSKSTQSVVQMIFRKE